MTTVARQQLVNAGQRETLTVACCSRNSYISHPLRDVDDCRHSSLPGACAEFSSQIDKHTHSDASVLAGCAGEATVGAEHTGRLPVTVARDRRLERPSSLPDVTAKQELNIWCLILIQRCPRSTEATGNTCKRINQQYRTAKDSKKII